MEQPVVKETKRHFSSIGLILFLGSLLVYGVQLLVQTIILRIPAIAANTSLSFIFPMLAMYIVAFPIIFLVFKKVPAQRVEQQEKWNIGKLLAAFAISYAGTFVCNLFANAVTLLIGLLKHNPVNNVLLDVVTSIHPLATFLIIVICAPIMEELLFRKAIIDRTIKYGEGIALVFSGLLFGLFHGNLVQFAYAFWIGIAFGYVYVKTGNIKYTIFLHMCINFLGSFFGSFLLEKSGFLEISELLQTATSAEESTAILLNNIGGVLMYYGYVICLIILVIVGIVLFFVNLKKYKLLPGEITIEKGKRFSIIILNLGMILYTLFWISQIILQLFS